MTDISNGPSQKSNQAAKYIEMKENASKVKLQFTLHAIQAAFEQEYRKMIR